MIRYTDDPDAEDRAEYEALVATAQAEEAEERARYELDAEAERALGADWWK